MELKDVVVTLLFPLVLHLLKTQSTLRSKVDAIGALDTSDRDRLDKIESRIEKLNDLIARFFGAP